MFAHFIGESLKKTKTREFVPSQEEIMALLTRQEMTTTVYCHGGGSCKISINSHTTAGEVSELKSTPHMLLQTFLWKNYLNLTVCLLLIQTCDLVRVLLRWWRS